MLDKAIITVAQQRLTDPEQPRSNVLDPREVGVYTQQLPQPCHDGDPFLGFVYSSHLVALCLFFGFAVTVANTVRFQVWEKESQNIQVRILSTVCLCSLKKCVTKI